MKLMRIWSRMLQATAWGWLLTSCSNPSALQKMERLNGTAYGSQPRTSAVISITNQTLTVKKNGRKHKTYSISSSRFGVGSKSGSRKTPLGNHRVMSKHGHGCRRGQHFKARRAVRFRTGITTRILYLCGRACPQSRCIYIHGTGHPGTIGRPSSNGCIHMKPGEMVEVFNLLQVNSSVTIKS